ncbi:HNH endonuclease signature motif containing protein [Pseudomonas aeruginosa]
MTAREEYLKKKFMHECFDYQDGKLIWKERPTHHFIDEWRQKIFNSRQAGCEAGTVVSGYRMVKFSWGKVGSHRIAFLMHHGFLPAEVDHINGDPLDNRIENLRAATHAENLRNIKTSTRNTSGQKGVSWHKKSGKWSVGIRLNGRWAHLGLFASYEDAVSCRKTAEQDIYGGFSNAR